jgi:glycosyltransferase involved in cell wall biosynthesis
MNVADTSIYKPAPRDDARIPYEQDLRLIYHGTIHERYGLDLAIQAIARVKEEMPGIHLTIVGGGEYVPRLMQLTRDLGVRAHVTFVGARPAEDLPPIIRSANVGIVPYRDDVFTGTLLPTKLMEYAAMGIPAIAARTSAIERYFGDTMVELFEPENLDDLVRCIRLLRNSPVRLAALAKASERFNQRYNWAEVGARYVALVRRLGNRPALVQQANPVN